MKTYKSKIGLELVIPLSILLGSIFVLAIYDKVWSAAFGVLLVGSFIAHMFLTTYYQIDGTTLRIKCGFLVNQTVDINTVKKITETNNPLSSPAASIDRLEISYNKFDSVLVSPKDKEGFIKELTTVHPTIEVRRKTNK